MLKVSPDDAELHDDVAMLYLSMGLARERGAALSGIGGVEADVAAAQFNLGTALAMAGASTNRSRRFEEALAMRPDYAQAHDNLGRVRLEQGRVDEALNHFQEAVRLDPQIRRTCLDFRKRIAQAGLGSGDRYVRSRAALPMNDALAAEIRAKREAFVKKKQSPNN